MHLHAMNRSLHSAAAGFDDSRRVDANRLRAIHAAQRVVCSPANELGQVDDLSPDRDGLLLRDTKGCLLWHGQVSATGHEPPQSAVSLGVTRRTPGLLRLAEATSI